LYAYILIQEASFIFTFRIVAIQFLHQSDTIKKIQKNKLRIEKHLDIKSEFSAGANTNQEDVKPDVATNNPPGSTIKEMNLRLADNLDLTRVHEKSKISLRPLARKNFVLDALKKQPVYEGYNELYKVSLFFLFFLLTEDNCCFILLLYFSFFLVTTIN